MSGSVGASEAGEYQPVGAQPVGSVPLADAARAVTERFGVATECGMGRRPAETVEPLLRLHREVAAPIVDGG